ncbi:CaiB/BaiF CoA transferase family protein [Blastochloris viridis]|uniref:Alpha-methylacyl-CoA racemase n=1 Tax=Blastochloris viridis TaxID=1079 RepID=A0A0H5BEA1_BLAVI|nr:CoA transferase [Blastochloris viridis]ALK09576.1 Formyl-coenzyme A transferase [Blastochloris viridis]BAS00536.1 alpha-methylacyl-CoA racemase [Blastochloris viridis]CUU42239.1 Formyl-coenzyme A transferase [Blastochloris viridis]
MSFSLPLSGLVVLDFTTLLPGPLASLMLAEAGAEVIKIERPEGESMRGFSPRIEGASLPFALLNRGKRGVTVDFKDPAQLAGLRPLIERADILIEQFRPGVMARNGLGYDAVKAINPRLIYCSISGYGQEGPRAQHAGHDLNFVAATGLLAGAPVENPTLPPVHAADIGGGTMPALINILLALLQRDKTGVGSRIDIGMTDAMFTFGWLNLAHHWGKGANAAASHAEPTADSPRYRLYPTADGRLVACAALEQKFWEGFCDALDLDAALRDDSNDPAATAAHVADIVGGRPAAHWRPILEAADCCATVAATLEEALADPHFVGRGLFTRRVALAEGVEIPALPLPIAEGFRRPDTVLPAPRLEAKSDATLS